VIFIYHRDDPWRVYRIVSLHPPGHPVTAAVFGTAIKETHCIQTQYPDDKLSSAEF
jgi:hypothetical protein